MNRALRIARFCGLAPLCAGIGIFFVWLVTRWQWLELAGFATLYLGALLFVVGLAALACYAGIARRKAQVPWPEIARMVLRGRWF